MKVGICVPCRDMVSSGFAFDLANLVGFTSKADLAMLTVSGTLIVNQRTNLAREAMDMGCTHVLYIDSDMRFPKDGLDRLLAHDKPIVAANYCTRKFPLKPVAFGDDYTEERVVTKPDSTGLEPIASIGMGFMLIKTEVFEKIGMPYFMIGFSQKTQEYTGEDIYFCRKARAAGFDVFLDHDLSKEIGHTGEMDFRHEHIWATYGDSNVQ